MKNNIIKALSLAALLSLGLASCNSDNNLSSNDSLSSESNNQLSDEVSEILSESSEAESISSNEESSFASEENSVSSEENTAASEEVSESVSESSSASEQISGNAFTSDISSSTQKLLAKTASGYFASAPLSAGTDSSISAKYEVTNNNAVDTVVYALSYTTKFTTIKMYIAVNTSTYKITGYTFDSRITTHNQDNRFTNGSWEIYEDGSCDSVSGSTISVNAIKSMNKAAINQAKKDY